MDRSTSLPIMSDSPPKRRLPPWLKRPLPPGDAMLQTRRLIDGLRSRPLLDGLRGAPPADVEALASAVERLAVLAADLGDLLVALDVNPVIVSATGCLAVDALVLPRRPG